jgi:ectoine hydroxylase-related dioxygenase (phytanoyl-CoA dioxygenase family)
MVFHRAGRNTSDLVRIGINNVFVKPILAQQIDLPKFLNGRYADDPELSLLLGYRFEAPTSVDNYRAKRLERISNQK